jgi:WXG100 family type VII secretion target
MSLRTTPRPAGSVGDGSFQTDTHVMLTAAQYVQHVADGMIDEVNRLMGYLESLDRSRWNGEAASAFAQAKERWATVSRQLHQSLYDIAQGLDNSRRVYDEAETDAQLGITSAAQGLPY